MFEKYPEELGMGNEYLEGENKDITRTMLQYVVPLRGIAALWDDRPPFSFTQWRDTPNGDIVILGFDDEFEEQCGILNATLFRRAIKAVLSFQGEKRPDTWFFIDEFDSLTAIPGFANFLSKSRSYQACVVIVLQAIEQLTRKYDKEHKSIIPELCAHKVLLQVTDESAEWTSVQLGEEEVFVTSYNENINSKERSMGTGEKPETRRIVSKSQIATMPIFKQDRKIHSWFLTAYLNNHPYYYEMTRDDIKHIWKTGGHKKDYEKVLDQLAYNLRPWTDTDRKRVGLPLKEEQQPEQESESQTQSVNDSEDDIPFWRPRTGRD